MKDFNFKINDNEYKVQIINVEENIASVEVNGTLYNVELEKALQKQIVRPVHKAPAIQQHQQAVIASSTPSTSGASPLKTPLPGTILDIVVAVGDTVKTGQKLIVLEAMKMENSIEAHRDGKIINIKVNRGDSVLEGDVLLTIG
ncbi:MAG: biotin/lipoyl-containing protein [Salinivirgaceae bacterium]|jgi:biotin carboxyl carrier protein|nr:acetyl-CoA carboxylase biotin carboxyl carrier protein subunit [Bacteroidales bacterium]HPX59889.1 acetyl-CoA carboxylase biotin carboxyl carrier protein subunit [Bacteroidales bacterium]